MHMKYVVVESEESGKQLFIFPLSVNHDDFVESLECLKHRKGYDDWERLYKKPISAGFTDGVKCFGYSGTLGLKSNPDDAKLLENGSGI